MSVAAREVSRNGIRHTDTPVTGFVAAVEYEDWGYLFLGVTAEDDWSKYSPTLEEMLDSVQFIE